MIVSFCNQGVNNLYLTGVGFLVDDTSITGMCQDKKNFYAVSQFPTPTLIVIKKKNFKVTRYLVDVEDAHSIAINGEVLYIVSTGRNRVIETNINNLNQREVIWRSSQDEHVNSIYINKDIYITAFGEWIDDKVTARNGYIYNVTKKRKEMEGIRHPHSLLVKDAFYYCESATGRVFRNKEVILDLSGHYTRGLAIKGDLMAVGISKNRKLNVIQECKVIVYNLKEKRIVQEIVFPEHDEIYDIMYET